MDHDPKEAADSTSIRTTASPATRASETSDRINAFFRNDLKGMVLQFLKEPLSGTYSLFEQRSPNAYFQSLVLTGTTAALYILLPFLFWGRGFRNAIEIADLAKFALIPVLFIVAMSVCSLGIKSISGRSDFKTELFTGALNAFPLAFGMLLFSLFVMFGGTGISDVGDLLNNMSAIMRSAVIYLIVLVYLLLMMINILQQSLKASGTKDALAYYISPAGVLFAWYVTFTIWTEFVV